MAGLRGGELAQGRDPDELGEAEISAINSEAFRGLLEFVPEQIADEAGLEAAEVQAALEALSTPFGEVPADLYPKGENRFRRFPVIPLGEDEFFFPSLWIPFREFVPWFLDFVRSEGHDRLADRFLRARDAAAERLTREALARVFGAEAVLGPLDYQADGVDTELDCLVDAHPLCLVAEVKAHRVSDAVWRGSPDRIRRFDTDLGKARAQADRVATYLRGGNVEFRDSESKRAVRLEGPPAEIRRLAVSFETVDPLMLRSGLDGEPAERIWTISLADLMMVCEVLDDPASFAAYLQTRTEIAESPNFLFIMEGDLGARVRDRALGLACRARIPLR